MKEFTFEIILDAFKKYFSLFIFLFILSIILSFIFIKTQKINYYSEKSLLSNNYENAPIITNLNKKLTKINNIQNLVNDQFVSLNRSTDESTTGNAEASSTYKLPDFIFNDQDEKIFTNDFILDQYFKILTTNNLASIIKNNLIRENKISSNNLKSLNSVKVTSSSYFNDGLKFVLIINHDQFIDPKLVDIFFNGLYVYANKKVNEKLVDIYTLYQLNYNQSLEDSINLLKSYLKGFDLWQQKLNNQLLRKLEKEIEYAKMIDQKWPFDNNMPLTGFTYSYVQGYEILEKEYQRVLGKSNKDQLFMSYEFVVDTLEGMLTQFDKKYTNLEDILKYNKDIQFMELRTEKLYNISIKRDTLMVFLTSIILSQIFALFISLLLFSLKRK